MASGPITTVYCSDLPLDMTDREFQNMFQFADGFQQSSLSQANSGNKLMGFARFETPEQAMMCVAYLHHRVVDAATRQTVKCVMAQKNLKPSSHTGKRSHVELSAPALGPLPKLPRAGQAQPALAASDFQQVLLACLSTLAAQPAQPAPPLAKLQHDTLYLTGFSPQTTEEEAQAYCASFAGFRELRFVNNGAKLFGLAQYHDTTHAAAAMAEMPNYSLNGQVLHVQFSKSPLNVPKSRH